MISSLLNSLMRPGAKVLPSLLLSAIMLPIPLLTVAQESSSADAANKLGAFVGASETEYPEWFKTSFLELEDDVAEAAEAGKRLMLVFHQDGCPYCSTFVERNLSQKDIVETLQTKFDAIEINMWGDREVASVEGKIYTEKTFAQALNVQFTPTVLFLNEAGGLALRINGYYDPDRFRVALDFVSGNHDKTQSFTEYVQEQGVDESSKKLIDRPYITGPLTGMVNRPGKGNKPLLILFEQGNCSNCQTLHDEILNKDESRVMLDQFDIYQVDMWGRDEFKTPDGKTTTGRQWSAELGVQYAPTLVLYTESGKQVIRSESYLRTFHTQSILDYVLTDAWQEYPSFQRYISVRSEEIREQGKDVNIVD